MKFEAINIFIMAEALELTVLGQLVLASICGGAIGLERELSGKEAGLRTNMLICVGAALLTVLSLRVGVYLVDTGSVMGDPSRLMAAVISGIGFLGAGTIIQARGNITGLTTAATLWVVAAIGIAIGAGAYVIASGSTFFVLAALIPLGQLEGRFLETSRHWVQATLKEDIGLIKDLHSALEDKNFEVINTDISLVEEARYEILFEIEGDGIEFLHDLPDIFDSSDNVVDVSIVPNESSS